MINIEEEIGKIYGCYKVIDFIPKQPKQKRQCVCECQRCGNIRQLTYDHVKHRLYTNCPNCKPPHKLTKNLIGQKYGRLTVMERVKSTNKKVMYLCKCECGNECIIQSHHLIKGHTSSCGCLVKEKAHERRFKNLIGQKFGRLTVLKKSNESYKGRTSWICQCECGNITTGTTTALYKGLKKSCGCLNSVAEEELAKFLGEQKIPYIRQYKFKECKDKKSLSFDFAILDKEYNLKCLIELNGQQHYKPYTYCNEEECIQIKNFEDRLKKDEIKRKYCEIHNIPLLEIPYYEFSKKETISTNFINKIR